MIDDLDGKLRKVQTKQCKVKSQAQTREREIKQKKEAIEQLEKEKAELQQQLENLKANAGAPIDPEVLNTFLAYDLKKQKFSTYLEEYEGSNRRGVPDNTNNAITLH